MHPPNLPRGPCWVEQQDAASFTPLQMSFEGQILHFANFFEEQPDTPSFQIDFQDWRDFAPPGWNPDFLVIYSSSDQARIIELTESGHKLKLLLLSF